MTEMVWTLPGVEHNREMLLFTHHLKDRLPHFMNSYVQLNPILNYLVRLRETHYQYRTLHSQTEHNHQCRKCLKAAQEFPQFLAGRFQGIHRTTWKRWTLAHSLKKRI